MTSKVPEASYGLRQRLGWVVGPAALLLTLLLPPPPGLSVEGWLTAGAAMLMAAFWIAESIPIPATALLPLVLFPALGLGNSTETAAPFAHPIIFLFLGGFILALAMQRWNLHRRVAIGLIGMLGTKPSSIIAGFLLGSALVSMWVSNTATSLMMLPIALSVVQLLPDRAHQTGVLVQTAKGIGENGRWRIAKLNGILYWLDQNPPRRGRTQLKLSPENPGWFTSTLRRDRGKRRYIITARAGVIVKHHF